MGCERWAVVVLGATGLVNGVAAGRAEGGWPKLGAGHGPNPVVVAGPTPAGVLVAGSPAIVTAAPMMATAPYVYAYPYAVAPAPYAYAVAPSGGIWVVAAPQPSPAPSRAPSAALVTRATAPTPAEPGSLLAAKPEALESVRALVRERVKALSAQGQDEVAIVVAAIGEASRAYAEQAGVDVASLDEPAREADRATIRGMIVEAAGALAAGGDGGTPTPGDQQPPIPTATTGSAGAGSTATANGGPAVWVVPMTPAVTAGAYAVVPVVPARKWWQHRGK